MQTRDPYVRNVKHLIVVDPRTFQLKIDLGFGVTHDHLVRVTSPILAEMREADADVLGEIFGQAGVRVTVRTERPADPMVRLPQIAPTWAEIFVNDEPLQYVVARKLAARQGELAL